jgi:hypothetical protein
MFFSFRLIWFRPETFGPVGLILPEFCIHFLGHRLSDPAEQPDLLIVGQVVDVPHELADGELRPDQAHMFF